MLVCRTWIYFIKTASGCWFTKRGRVMMTKMGPNDTRCIIWTLGECFFLLSCLLILVGLYGHVGQNIDHDTHHVATQLLYSICFTVMTIFTLPHVCLMLIFFLYMLFIHGFLIVTMCTPCLYLMYTSIYSWL